MRARLCFVLWALPALVLCTPRPAAGEERHVVRMSEAGVRDLELDKAKLGQAALGGLMGAAVGAVAGSSTMASSGAEPDMQDGVSHLWAGLIGGTIAAYESQSLEAKTQAKKEAQGDNPPQLGKVEKVSQQDRIKMMKEGASIGLMAGVVGGSMAQVFSGSSDEGGSSASMGSSSSSSNDKQEGGANQQKKPTALASSGELAILHTAVAGAVGGGVAGYMEPELLLLGELFGGALKTAHKHAKKAAAKAGEKATEHAQALKKKWDDRDKCKADFYKSGKNCQACRFTRANCKGEFTACPEAAETDSSTCACTGSFLAAEEFLMIVQDPTKTAIPVAQFACSQHHVFAGIELLKKESDGTWKRTRCGASAGFEWETLDSAVEIGPYTFPNEPPDCSLAPIKLPSGFAFDMYTVNRVYMPQIQPKGQQPKSNPTWKQNMLVKGLGKFCTAVLWKVSLSPGWHLPSRPVPVDSECCRYLRLAGKDWLQSLTGGKRDWSTDFFPGWEFGPATGHTPVKMYGTKAAALEACFTA